MKMLISVEEKMSLQLLISGCVAFIFKIVHDIPVKCQVTMVTGCGKCAVGSDGHCCPARVPLVQM